MQKRRPVVSPGAGGVPHIGYTLLQGMDVVHGAWHVARLPGRSGLPLHGADVHGRCVRPPAAGLALARPALARPALQGLGAGDSARAARPGAGLARRVVLVPAAFILAVFAHLDAQPHDVGGARVAQAWAHTVQLITHLPHGCLIRERGVVWLC